MSMEANTIPKTLLKFTNSDYPISNSLSQSQSQRQRKEKEHLQCTQLPGKETKQVSSILTVWHKLKIKIKIHTLSWSSYYQKPLWETLSKRLLYQRTVSEWMDWKERRKCRKHTNWSTDQIFQLGSNLHGCLYMLVHTRKLFKVQIPSSCPLYMLRYDQLYPGTNLLIGFLI